MSISESVQSELKDKIDALEQQKSVFQQSVAHTQGEMDVLNQQLADFKAQNQQLTKDYSDLKHKWDLLKQLEKYFFAYTFPYYTNQLQSGVCSDRGVPPSFGTSFCLSFHSSFLLGPSLICYSFSTTEWNWMKLSQNLYYMFSLCTSSLRIRSKSIWGFHMAIHGLSHLWIWGQGDPSLIQYSPIPLNGIEWNFHRILITCSRCHCAPPK